MTIAQPPAEEPEPKGQKARKKTRRGHGEGSIYQRKDGRWSGHITLENGKRKLFYGKTRKEVQDKVNDALYEQKQGTLTTGKQQSMKQFLNYWLEDVHKPTIRVGTYIGYRIVLDTHLLPALGSIKLQKLTAQQVQGVLAQKRREGLSSGRIIFIRAVLHTALSHAVAINLVARNVCDVVAKPRLVKREVHPLTLEQAKQLMQAASGHPLLEGLLPLTIATGMRRGEILALRWSDIDLVSVPKTVQVRRTMSRMKQYGLVESEPKTAKSQRLIVLPQFVVEALVHHRARQEETKRNVGQTWQDNNLVFTNRRGGRVEPTHLDEMFEKLLHRAGLPDIHFHDLRHNAATMLLGMGVHPKVVQELLGHSSITMTMDTYSHVLPTMQQEAMSKLNDAFKSYEQDQVMYITFVTEIAESEAKARFEEIRLHMPYEYEVGIPRKGKSGAYFITIMHQGPLLSFAQQWLLAQMSEHGWHWHTVSTEPN